MRTLATFILALGFLLLTQACDKKEAPAPEESCHFQQNSYLQRVSWAQKPVSLYSDATIDGDQVESLKKAMVIWNDIFREDFGGKDIFVYAGSLSEEVGWAQDGKNVISLTKNWQSPATEQAETRLIWAENYIVDADIRLNGNKNLAKDDNIRSDELDTVALMVHELGHVLGLAHIDGQYSVMNESLGLGDLRREIGSVEVDALRCEY
jgi:hypothetical protein